MRTLELTDEEVEILSDLTQRHLHELDLEVLHTDTHNFKEKLKHRQQVLAGVLRKISTLEPAQH